MRLENRRIIMCNFSGVLHCDMLVKLENDAYRNLDTADMIMELKRIERALSFCPRIMAHRMPLRYGCHDIRWSKKLL